MEGILMGKKNAEDSLGAQKTDEPVEYMAEDQGVGGFNEEKPPRKQPENIGILSILRKIVETWNPGEMFNKHRSDCASQIKTSAVFSDLEQELADYNGDEENEGEFEADKQAELAQV